MPLVPARYCYASVTDFRQYLAGTGFADNWTQDTAPILRLLEAVSRTMEQHLGDRRFGPRTETRTYDLGVGSLRNNASLQVRQPFNLPDYWTTLGNSAIIPLDDWLLTATTITAYADTARTSSQALTAGTDYLLEPYNSSPKHTLKLNENSTHYLSAGQQTLTVAGTWGYQNTSTTLSAAAAEAMDASETGYDVVSGAAFAVGQTVLADSEQMYITAITTNTLTVERGVNGTTAATHLTGIDLSILRYPSDVISLCLELARNRYRESQAGVSQMIGDAASGLVISRPGAEEKVLLQRLDRFIRSTKGHASVNF